LRIDVSRAAGVAFCDDEKSDKRRLRPRDWLCTKSNV
jgi:hypothetical protein